MKLIVPIMGLFAVLAVASTDGKGDVKMVDLAEELARSRQDLAKAREEIKEIIRRENEKLQAEDDKIKKENQQLRREMAKLRRDNSEIKKTQRQKDQNNTLELQHFLKDSIRQKDSDLKKLMIRQIDEYLQVNKICVAGVVGRSNVGTSGQNDHIGTSGQNDHAVNFGHTFARVPTFSASLKQFSLKSGGADLDAPYSVLEVTKSSAKLSFYATRQVNYFYVAWIACL